MNKRFKPMTPTQEREIITALKVALPGMKIREALIYSVLSFPRRRESS